VAVRHHSLAKLRLISCIIIFCLALYDIHGITEAVELFMRQNRVNLSLAAVELLGIKDGRFLPFPLRIRTSNHCASSLETTPKPSSSIIHHQPRTDNHIITTSIFKFPQNADGIPPLFHLPSPQQNLKLTIHQSDIQVGWYITSLQHTGEQKIIEIQHPYYRVADGSWVNWENIRTYRQGAWDMEAFGQ
jgi:hypothetical protein